MKQNEFSLSESTGKIKRFIEKQHSCLSGLERTVVWRRGEEAEVERVCDLQLLAEDK